VSIARAPFLRSDGTICDQVGYDVKSGVLLIKSDAILPVPQNPTKKEALEALAKLRAPFNEMPWRKGTNAESAFLALVLTLATRPILPLVPGFTVSAPMPGSGKTLALECAALLVHGLIPTTRSYPHDKDEQRKVLQAVMLAGDLLIHFDNVKEGTLIGGESLNACLTSGAMGDRILGHSSAPRVVNSTTFTFTGNNISAQRECARRALAIELDADSARPEKRTFKIPNLKAYVREHRPGLLCAVLTMLRAFVVAGAPKPNRKEPVGSFERWDELVVGCLLWLDLPDPMTTQDDLRAEDEEASGLDEMFAQLALLKPDGASFQTRDVIKAFAASNALDEAVRNVCDGTPKGIGDWLSASRGKITTDGKLKLVVKKGRPAAAGVGR
jgi:putative DNA primase/helicase